MADTSERVWLRLLTLWMGVISMFLLVSASLNFGGESAAGQDASLFSFPSVPGLTPIEDSQRCGSEECEQARVFAVDHGDPCRAVFDLARVLSLAGASDLALQDGQEECDLDSLTWNFVFAATIEGASWDVATRTGEVPEVRLSVTHR